MTAECLDIVVEVIADDEEDIGFRFRILGGGTGLAEERKDTEDWR